MIFQMSYKVEASRQFVKEAKRLSKKYPSLKQELSVLIENLSKNPNIGISIGSQVFQIRLAIASKGKGKSGGGRVITYVYIEESRVLLLTIYNKGEKESVTDFEIKELLSKYS